MVVIFHNTDKLCRAQKRAHRSRKQQLKTLFTDKHTHIPFSCCEDTNSLLFAKLDFKCVTMKALFRASNVYLFKKEGFPTTPSPTRMFSKQALPSKGGMDNDITEVSSDTVQAILEAQALS